MSTFDNIRKSFQTRGANSWKYHPFSSLYLDFSRDLVRPEDTIEVKHG